MKILLIIIAILALLLTLSGLYIRHQANKLEDSEAQVSYLQSDFKTKADSIGRSFKDKSDLWHNQVATLQLTNLSLKQLEKDKDKEILRIRAMFPKIKPNFRNLDAYTDFKTSNKTIASGSLLRDSVMEAQNDTLIDSIKPLYEGSSLTTWDAYKIRLYGSGSCKLDSFQIDRSGKEEFNQVMYWTRKWFLGRKKYSSETVSLNPNTAIISQNSLVVKKR